MRKVYYEHECKIYLIVAISCGFIIFLSNLIVTAPNTAMLLSNAWTVTFDGTQVASLKPPIYYSGEDKEFSRGVYTFDYKLRLDEEILRTLKTPVIVLPGISGNGLRVSLNDEVLGMNGDLASGRASIWNFSYAFFIPPQLLGEDNTLSIELYNLYEVGLNKIPYIADSGRPVKFRISMIFWSVNLMLFVIGGMLILGFVFFVTGLMGETRASEKIFLGLALFFISIFFLDYSYVDNTAIRYLLFKKIVISSQFTGLLFFILYISELTSIKGNRITLFFSIFLCCLVISTIVYPGDMVQFRKFYQFAYLSNLALFIYLIYMFIKKIDHSHEMITIFSGGFAALIFALHDVVCLFADGGQTFFSHYGLTVLFLSGALVMVLQIINTYIEYIRQSSRAEQFYAESMRDPLTGAYNRKILPALEAGINSDFSVLLFDLDDFKMINDTFGHGAGDLSLKAFSKLINSIIRSNDYVVRIGGDEFIAVLPGCAIWDADEQGCRICTALEGFELAHKDKSFTISATMGTAFGKRGSSLAEVIDEADIEMYKKKQFRSESR